MNKNQTDEHEHWMRLAMREAEVAGANNEVPVGAVLIKNGYVLGLGQNHVERANDPTAHAEMYAIRAASEALGYERLTDATLYVTLEPCSMCAGAIVLARIQRLVIGASDPKTGACGSLMNIVQDERLNHSVDVLSGILADESATMLRRFFRTVRRASKSSL